MAERKKILFNVSLKGISWVCEETVFFMENGYIGFPQENAS